MLSRTAVRRTAAVVAGAALAGTVLAACGTQHGGSGATGAAGAVAVAHGPTGTPTVPAQRTAPPSATGSQSAPAHSVPSQRTSPPSQTPSDAPATSGTSGGTTATAPAHGGAAPSSGHAGESIQHSLEDGGKSVALTFDDGPDPRWTPQILALLAQHHAKATFCEIGPNAAAHPDLVRRITAEGHRLCDHSVHHDEQQSGKSLTYNTHEIVDAQSEISQAAGPGAQLWYYRAPGGDFTPPIRHIAADHGLRPLGWTADSRDWARPGTDTVLRNIDHDLRPGSIVLMHDGGGDRTETVQALGRLLDQLDASGWTYSFPAR